MTIRKMQISEIGRISLDDKPISISIPKTLRANLASQVNSARNIIQLNSARS